MAYSVTLLDRDGAYHWLRSFARLAPARKFARHLAAQSYCLVATVYRGRPGEEVIARYTA